MTATSLLRASSAIVSLNNDLSRYVIVLSFKESLHACQRSEFTPWPFLGLPMVSVSPLPSAHSLRHFFSLTFAMADFFDPSESKVDFDLHEHLHLG